LSISVPANTLSTKMLKRSISFLIIISCTHHCFAQDTLEIKRKISGDVTEIYKVLPANVNIRQGLFRALYKKKIPVAVGMFENDKKVGLWKFAGPDGTVLQTYDYSTKRLFYEAPEDTTSKLRYIVDKELKPGDRTTKPIKIGGRYYGYLPYLTLFTIPKELKNIDRDYISAIVELLISPGGRLASYKVNLVNSPFGQPIQTVNMNIKLPDPADVVFTPATLNGEPIACRIIIRCAVNSNGHLNFE
jgi:hypothetical protein